MCACECSKKRHFFLKFSHRLKRRMYQHSAHENPIQIKELVSRKRKIALRRAEHRQRRVAHKRHEMRSERSEKSYKYWNLHSVVMSDYSLIATRNSHAKHNQSVGRIPERGQGRVAHQRHEMSSERESKKLQILELTRCSHVGLYVDSHPKCTCQNTIN